MKEYMKEFIFLAVYLLFYNYETQQASFSDLFFDIFLSNRY